MNTLGYLSNWSQDCYILFDESICQKVVALSIHSDFEFELINQILPVIPKPDALIHCDIEFEKHLSQFKLRAKRRGYHVLNSQYFIQSDEDLLQDLKIRREITKYLAEQLEQMGVPVLWLDLAAPIPDNLNQIDTFLSSQNFN